MNRAGRAGVMYGAAAFALGFVFGALRVGLIAPAVGPVAAVLIELPLMLVLLWPIGHRLAQRWNVPGKTRPRLAMGATALAILITAECALGVIGFNRTWTEVIAGMTRPEGWLGLAGQVIFAAFPWLQARRTTGFPPPST